MNIVKNFLTVLKKSTTDAIKTASKRAIQKTAEPTSDLNCSKTADKITSISKSSNELHSRELLSETWEWNRYTKRKQYISRKKTTNYWWIKISKII